MYRNIKEFSAGLELAASLYKEVKKLDDKALLVEVRENRMMIVRMESCV